MCRAEWWDTGRWQFVLRSLLPKGDVLALRAELQTQLGANMFSDYYRLLATFLSAKLSCVFFFFFGGLLGLTGAGRKREFDNYIKHNLKEKVALHNAFVLAILGQAFATTPPPEVLGARGAKRSEKRRPKKAKLSGSLPIKVSERKRHSG